jgi:hypothetical protein
MAGLSVAVANSNAAQMAEKLDLPSRSTALRQAIVGELERDVTVVAATPPKNLLDSEQRQGVLSSITRNAGTVLGWSESSPITLINVAALTIANREPDSPPAIDISISPPATETETPDTNP